MDETGDRNPSPDLTVSIATWNNRDLVGDCLRSVHRSLGPQSPSPGGKSTGVAAETFVVDNDSTDGTPGMIRAEFPWVRLICNEEPRGFSFNHNQVLRRATGRYVLLLNDDTAAIDDALAQAVEFMETHDNAGAVGCTLVKPDGTPERISQRFPHPLDPFFPWLRRKIDPRKERDTWDQSVEVDRLSGACLMVRREVLDKVGLLDEQFDPAYGEDTDLCWRVKAAGWKIYRLRQAWVTHLRGQTTKRELPDRVRLLQEAKFRWYRKNRGRPALWLYMAAVIVASLVQLLVCWLTLLFPRRREEAREKIRRIWARLRSG